jgi:hypothetical protein
MNYLDTIELLKECFTDLEPNGTFVRGRRPDASLMSVNAAWPLVALLPFRETKDYAKGNIQRQIVMFFLKNDTPNNTSDQRDIIINDMNEMQDAFINKLNEKVSSLTSAYYGKASIQGSVLATPEQMILAGAASGYGIQFTLLSKIPC